MTTIRIAPSARYIGLGILTLRQRNSPAGTARKNINERTSLLVSPPSRHQSFANHISLI